MAQACGPVIAADKNPALILGAAIGALARAGRDKLTFITSPRLDTFGYWTEQLIAESTGKEGVGILPVEGERLASPAAYKRSRDRVFVHLRLDGAAGGKHDKAVAALTAAGHPVIELRLPDVYALGGEFLRWEIATAAAGFVLGIDPFDQPNVQESKDNTVRLLKEHETAGQWPASDDTLAAVHPYFSLKLLRHLKSAKRGDYVALTAYFERTARRERLLRDVQAAIRDQYGVAVTVGYGPRFLHSTGQLHKGGANNGVFVQFTATDALDAPVPGEAYSFSVLKQAQALGDYQALLSHSRRALRVNLGSNVDGGLRQVLAAVTTNAPSNGHSRTAKKPTRNGHRKNAPVAKGRNTRTAKPARNGHSTRRAK
jgi:hypothetical protein